MAGIIVFELNSNDNRGVSQNAAKSMPTGATYDTGNMADVLVAAGKSDTRIGGVVMDQPKVFDFAALKPGISLTTGLLKMPEPLPKNAPYHALAGEKQAAIKNVGYLSVKEAMHISHSCSDPHMTVVIYNTTGGQVGQNIHVCAEYDGAKWVFTKVHG